MRAHKHLERLLKTCKYRLSALRKLSLQADTTSIAHKRIIAYVTIEFLNTWANFCRSYYLSCVCSAVTVKGHKIRSSSNLTINQAIGVAINLCKRYPVSANSNGTWNRRDEPTWHSPNVLMKVCAHIACSNINNIQNSFALGSRVFDDLPVYRNYFGHRNESTLRSVRTIAANLGVSPNLRPAEMLMTVPLRANRPLLVEWLDDATITAELLCE